MHKTFRILLAALMLAGTARMVRAEEKEETAGKPAQIFRIDASNAALSQDGTLIAYVETCDILDVVDKGKPYTVRVIRAATGAEIWSTTKIRFPARLGFTADGNLLVGNSSEIHTISLPGGEIRTQPKKLTLDPNPMTVLGQDGNHWALVQPGSRKLDLLGNRTFVRTIEAEENQHSWLRIIRVKDARIAVVMPRYEWERKDFSLRYDSDVVQVAGQQEMKLTHPPFKESVLDIYDDSGKRRRITFPGCWVEDVQPAKDGWLVLGLEWMDKNPRLSLWRVQEK